MAAILKNVLSFKNEQGVVYSQFVSGEGLAVFRKLLNLNNYEEYTPQLSTYGIKQKKKMYAQISGGISAEDRDKIVVDYNKERIKLLIFSSAGAEGLDLKGVRHLHIT